MIRHRVLSFLVLAQFGLPAAAADFALTLPDHSEITAQVIQPMASLALPIGPFQNGAMMTRTVQAPLAQTVYRMALPPQATSQDVMTPLRDQLAAAGFAVDFECETRVCGGFDFRYGMELLPEPDMHVDLGDFRYVLAQRDDATISLMVSRSPSYGFVQMTLLGASALPAAKVTESSKSPVLAPLNRDQTTVLEDVVFDSASADLAKGDYASLAAVADVLIQNPAQRLIINGYTDSSGNAAANLALSQARANTLRDLLAVQYGIDPARITATGQGDSAPRASNDTPQGRAKNRRVEVVITTNPAPVPHSAAPENQ